MAEQPKRICLTCGKEVWDLRRRDYCSSNCADAAAAKETAEDPPKPPKRKPPPNPRPLESPNGVGSIGQPENGEPDKPKSKGGPGRNRGKSSPELLADIFYDIAQGQSERDACFGNGVRPETFSRWKNLPENEGMREKANYLRLKKLIANVETEKFDWRRWQWLAQKHCPERFGDPAKVGVQVNQQFNNGDLVSNQAEADEARQRLDECKILEAKRKTGVATNTELLEYVNDEIEQLQYLRDRLLTGETPDQETQKQLYRLHEEKRDREQQPIRTVEGHVTGQLAIEDESRPKPAPEPRRAAPSSPQDMRASDMDPLSGVAKPAEPHIPWRDRKPSTGPLSERQRQRLAQERERMGGEGKSPFGGGQD